jgi:hypothetical protein
MIFFFLSFDLTFSLISADKNNEYRKALEVIFKFIFMRLKDKLRYCHVTNMYDRACDDDYHLSIHYASQ